MPIYGRDKGLSKEVLEARARAERLLRSHLSPDQVRDLDQHNWFEVHVADRVYRLLRGRMGNVRLMCDGKAVAQFCIHPKTDVPDADTMLAQKLMLESDEESFLRIANRSELMGRYDGLYEGSRVRRGTGPVEVRPLDPVAREEIITRSLLTAEGRERLASAVWTAARYHRIANPNASSETTSAEPPARVGQLEIAARLAAAYQPGDHRIVRAMKKWAAFSRHLTEISNAA